MLHSRPPSENFFPGTLWSREIYVGDPYTFLFVKRGILQFVYVKPLLAVLTMVLKATGKYQDGEISWSSSYLYLTFFYNLSVCLSLWCLMVFFYATKKDLPGFRPLPKFLCVKAIIFFSFWQSVIIALLVSAGVIPEGEGENHISVAIQDFLICLEMIPAAIAHSYSFSYEDYYDRNVHSARMPIMYAIRDSFGLKDVAMDSLDTLRGSKFNYRSFEPSEGVPHIGSSRTSRIMAGLRYSTSTAKKHWLEPAPVSRYLSAGRGMNGEIVLEEAEPLEFDDPNPWDEVEALFEQSRTMVYGDYNYPVIDFRAPLWKQTRHAANPSPTGFRSRGYGGTGSTTREENPQQQKRRLQQGHTKKGKLRQPSIPHVSRDGCVDVVVEQGKGNYVVVPDIIEPQFQGQPLQHEQQRQPPKHKKVPQSQQHIQDLLPPPSPPASASESLLHHDQMRQQHLRHSSSREAPRHLRPSKSTPQTSYSEMPLSQQRNNDDPNLLRPEQPQPQPSFSSPHSTSPPVTGDAYWPEEHQQQQQSNTNIYQIFDDDNDALFSANIWK
ncbi:organic solute transporter Ostalpha-domain-containing protein [Dichotomocladium elegans]|nr:organic solute transporter Ostalpha-domain-containing protein [Dichotomocladium elegans]